MANLINIYCYIGGNGVDWTGILGAIVAGALTGYITNDYAVKMIFKEYHILGFHRFKVGGMILKTRDQFVENVSELVERDVINNRTIETELASYEFQKEFYKLVEAVVNKHLYNNTPDITIAEIPGSKEVFENLTKFYKDNARVIMGDFIKPLLDMIDIEDVLSAKQNEHLTKQLFTIMLEELKENDIIEDCLKGFYQENKELLIGDFIDAKIFRTLEKNLKQATDELHQKLEENYDTKIDATMEKICATVELKKLIGNAERGLKEKTLLQLLGKEKSANIANELLQRILQAAKTPEGQEKITDLVSKGLEILKTVNKPVLSIFDEGLSKKFENYLMAYLPELIEKILLWIRKNKKEINALLNKAVDDVLEAGSTDWYNVQGKAKKIFKDNFIDNVADKYKIVEKVLKYIENETDIKAISVELSRKIVKYLKTKEVSEIIGDLEKKGIIRADIILQLINNNIDQHLGKLDLSMFDYFFEKKLGSFFQVDLSKYMEKFITNSLQEQIKAKFLYTPKGIEILQKEITARIRKISSSRLKNLWNKEEVAALAAKGNKLIINSKVVKDSVKGQIKEGIEQYIKDKKVICLCSEKVLQVIYRTGADKSLSFLQEGILNLNKKAVKSFYAWLKKQKGMIRSFTGTARDIINKNMHVLLKGRVKEAVAANLKTLPDKEIQEIVEDFMGKELKPINFFGALLGGIVGALSFLISSTSTVTLSFIPNVIIAGGIFALVGYGTNVIALKMIFEPYNAKKILGLKVPFTPGVITKQKPRFAKSMASFVDEKLLTVKAIKNIFLEKREGLGHSFKEYIAADNYGKLHQLLTNNRDIVAVGVLAAGMKVIEGNKTGISKALAGELKHVRLSNFAYGEGGNQLQQQAKKYMENLSQSLSSYANKSLQSEISLQQALPNFLLVSIYAGLEQMVEEKVQNCLDNLEAGNKIEEFVSGFSEEVNGCLEKKPSELLTEKQIAEVKETISSYIIARFCAQETRVSMYNWLEEQFKKELTPEKRIGDIFGGMLISVVRQNAAFIIENLIVAAQDKLQNNRRTIKKEVYTRFKESADVMDTVWDFVLDIESSIYDVVDDLVDDKLPTYLGGKKKELQNILDSFIKVNIGDSLVGNLDPEFSSEGIIKIMDKLLANENLDANVRYISDSFVDVVANIPLKQLLRVASVQEVLDVYKVFAGEIEEARRDLVFNIKDKRQVIVEATGVLIADIVKNEILSLPVKELSADIGPQAVESCIKNIVERLGESPAFNRELSVYIKAVLEEAKDKALEELLDFAIFEQDSVLCIDKLLDRQVVKEKVLQVLEKNIGLILEDGREIVTADTKKYIINILVTSVLEALEEHLLPIINAVNVKKVTERQINAMDPQEIKNMFDSFAKEYFKKIEKYGLLGGAIGIVGKLIEKVIK